MKKNRPPRRYPAPTPPASAPNAAPQMTHQGILDRMAEIAAARSVVDRELNERQRQEYAKLRDECGRIGHLFGRSDYIIGPGVACVICHAARGDTK